MRSVQRCLPVSQRSRVSHRTILWSISHVIHHKRIIRAVFVIGMALSMFFDGIVLHQLLQWHHMVSHWYAPTTIAALELNTLWDGLFHAAAWIVIILGVALLWQATRSGRPSVPNSMVAGALMAGGGTFNIVENLVNHFILQIHHVRETGTQHVFAYDVGFFSSSVLYRLQRDGCFCVVACANCGRAAQTGQAA